MSKQSFVPYLEIEDFDTIQVVQISEEESTAESIGISELVYGHNYAYTIGPFELTELLQNHCVGHRRVRIEAADPSSRQTVGICFGNCCY